MGVMEGCPKQEEERREELGRAWWKQAEEIGRENVPRTRETGLCLRW